MTEKEEKLFREGFELAVENAMVYEDDGWGRCAPYVDWKLAREELEKFIAKCKRIT